MNDNIMNKKINVLILSFGIIALGSLFMFSGCSDTLEGDVNENLAPIVEFVNIPPEGQYFSRNPEVYWIGSDPDGQIDYYQYHIATMEVVDANGGKDVYPESVPNEQWSQINIDLSKSDPHTTNVLPLTADTLNPVSNPVGQYIFLRAYDREGKSSDIVSRLFNRNDNPPETRIRDISNQVPFINSVFEGGVVTGLRFNWVGTDVKDYDEIGLSPPPFDFEWRLFGPYEDSTLEEIQNTLVRKIIVTSDANIKRPGDYLYVDCVTNQDTSYCDSILLDQAYIDTVSDDIDFTVEEILLVDSSLIKDKLVTSSFNGVDEWVQNERDTLYNVFKNESSDTTVQKNFIFWVRSRDDALVKDLTPAFVMFPVIDPRYERDIAVIDFTADQTYGENHSQYVHRDTAKAFWYNTITNWASTRSEDIIFDTAFFADGEAEDIIVGRTGIDYIIPSALSRLGGIPPKFLLKHKVIILYNESIIGSGFTGATVNYPEILSAMDAGIGVWATWRNPLQVNATQPEFQTLIAPTNYRDYFGVLTMTYSSWIQNAGLFGFRNDDFIGAYSLDESQWPALDIDTSLLHTRHEWYNIPILGWMDSIAALQEVNWAARAPGTEAMYLYKSLYGANYLYDYEGAPVGHRLESTYFRSVHFCFTLLAMEATQAQTISNHVFDWLYKPNLNSSSVQADRFKDAPVKIDMQEARERYGKRLIDQAAMRSNSGN